MFKAKETLPGLRHRFFLGSLRRGQNETKRALKLAYGLKLYRFSFSFFHHLTIFIKTMISTYTLLKLVKKGSFEEGSQGIPKVTVTVVTIQTYPND